MVVLQPVAALQERDDLRAGAAVVRRKTPGADALGDVLLYRPLDSGRVVGARLHVRERIARSGGIGMPL